MHPQASSRGRNDELHPRPLGSVFSPPSPQSVAERVRQDAQRRLVLTIERWLLSMKACSGTRPFDPRLVTWLRDARLGVDSRTLLASRALNAVRSDPEFAALLPLLPSLEDARKHSAAAAPKPGPASGS